MSLVFPTDIRWIGVFLLFGFFYNGKAQITGVVIAEDGETLPSASVLLLPDSLRQITDLDGGFLFERLPEGHYDIEITYLGFQKKSQHIHYKEGQQNHLVVYLQPAGELLPGVVVTDEHDKQEEVLSSEHFSSEYLRRNRRGTFAKSLEKMAGVSAINVGVGIAKPVIRGLSGNRIIVNQFGIKQEGQQWGQDHGLEIDPFAVERAEIIKGPASLQYGSDGLGGVINVFPGKILPEDSYEAQLNGVYKSNNEHRGGSAKFGLNINNVFAEARWSEQRFSDYRVPANTFDYNGFTLGINNERLKNTAGKETNRQFTLGATGKWGISRIVFSEYNLDAGLFSGAVGIPRSYTLEDDGNDRDIDVPKQEVTHRKVSLHQLLYFGSDHLSIDLGYQQNLRTERSFPEFHAIPSSQIDPNNTEALAFDLQTWSANAHLEKHLSVTDKLVLGINAQYQENERAGFEFLLPDFQTFRSGAYGIWTHETAGHHIFQAGLRADYGNNSSHYNKQYVWNSNETIIDSLEAPPTDDNFFNWSASVGMSRPLGELLAFKLNLGKSFRIPYPSETVSNGIHHGTFRHEQGQSDLESEHGYQLDAGLNYQGNRFQAQMAAYFNYFDQYIYLGPSSPARFSRLPEAGQVFQYRQDNAIYTGFELDYRWRIRPQLEWQQVADYVRSYNTRTGLALPFTPQPAIKSDLSWTIWQGDQLENAFLQASHEYHFAAEGPHRTDRTELETPAYQLWNFSAGARLNLWGQKFHFDIQVQNALDTRYLAHLSRYRWINIPEQGRNFVLSIYIPVTGSL